MIFFKTLWLWVPNFFGFCLYIHLYICRPNKGDGSKNQSEQTKAQERINVSNFLLNLIFNFFRFYTFEDGRI